eukprot:CAMPEP_0174902002 /NCGR_PEP_ID=MMETSP0167-20121228/36390_1 /TAXON_ID=38298 /ORGANISM="Rhodella maculata, Strain CCMP736" /LENGTH=172 /DNA_ID=CAMNT_0016143859 /DNA_START=175 /DNA_END=690 /DNA_ORIENTATION=+
MAALLATRGVTTSHPTRRGSLTHDAQVVLADGARRRHLAGVDLEPDDAQPHGGAPHGLILLIHGGPALALGLVLHVRGHLMVAHKNRQRARLREEAVRGDPRDGGVEDLAAERAEDECLVLDGEDREAGVLVEDALRDGGDELDDGDDVAVAAREGGLHLEDEAVGERLGDV